MPYENDLAALNHLELFSAERIGRIGRQDNRYCNGSKDVRWRVNESCADYQQLLLSTASFAWEIDS